MKKVLVPTDFSANSKSGIRFAIHWAALQKLELVFVHVLHILRATQWTDTYYEKYAKQEEQNCSITFKKFIAGIYSSMKIKPGRHSFVIIQGISADVSILDYCSSNPGIDYICISTHGAGKLKRIWGTNTGNLITKSPFPVLAVPGTYRFTGIRRMMYAADFNNYEMELNRVVDFALPLKAQIEILHFSWPGETAAGEKMTETALNKKYKYGLKVHYENNDAVHSLTENIQQQINKRKPSLVIMFTNQERTFFQKLFLSSKAEELSFKTKVPLLVFNKNK
jgi:nucleotide-binding universal stress UspA family protein